jgi:hypothetical protein
VNAFCQGKAAQLEPVDPTTLMDDAKALEARGVDSVVRQLQLVARPRVTIAAPDPFVRNALRSSQT